LPVAAHEQEIVDRERLAPIQAVPGRLLTMAGARRISAADRGKPYPTQRVSYEEEMMAPSDSTRFPRAGPGFSLRNVSRRRFFGIGAGAAGSVLGAGLWTPARSAHDEHDEDDKDEQRPAGRPCPEQNPIPHINQATIGIGGFRFFFPGPIDGSPAATDHEPPPKKPGRDPSTIFDFDGVVGQADLTLTGTGTDTTTGASAPYGFHTDMRFIAGRFVGTDGKIHKGTFAFI
jgi:hypothetical protein